MIVCMSLPTDQALRVLRSLIDRLGLSKREAARIVGLDNTVLTDWYNGKSKPKNEKSVIRLSMAVDTLTDYERKTAKSDMDFLRVGVRLVKVLSKVITDDSLHSEGNDDVIEVMDWGTGSERYGFKITDDAMRGDLKEGQIVIADDSIRPDPNHIVLIETCDGERMVRAIHGHGSATEYQANDSQYPAYKVGRAKLVGVVVEVMTKVSDDEVIRHQHNLGMRRKK